MRINKIVFFRLKIVEHSYARWRNRRNSFPIVKPKVLVGVLSVSRMEMQNSENCHAFTN